ncbi:MAG: hypothetical protein J6M92_16020 [Oribacterium sp.]|nr:hypothetical protein [Oribacterium sp.]
MKSNLLLNRIQIIQNEYRELLIELLPKLKGYHAPEALDEINLFWMRHIDEVQLFLRSWFPGDDSYIFTAITYMDFDDNEHLPFLLLGNRHIFDDPLSKYAEIRNNMSESKDANFLSEQIGITAEDNIKVLENSHGEILILPVRLFNQVDSYNSFFRIGEQAFVSLFNGIDSLDDYFSKCSTIDDIKQFARKDIGSLVMFSDDDDMSQPFEKRFSNTLDNTQFMVDPNKQDSYNFFMLVYGCIQQAIDVITSCVEYGCIPFIRYPVALHYISLLSENMLDIDHIITLRYKMSVAFIVYNLCDKDKLSTRCLDDFLKKKTEYGFNKILFNALDESGINENNFFEHPIAQIVATQLEKFYSLLSESEDSNSADVNFETTP